MKKGSKSSGIDRREMVRLTAGAVIAGPRIKTLGPLRHKFLTAAEFALLDELGELIIPADDHSPGARAALCADYLDRSLFENPRPEEKQKWRDGLGLIDAMSGEMFGKPFLKTSVEERNDLLSRISSGEANPKTPAEKFFVLLKSAVAHAYYTSRIGLRVELEYKGNSYLSEFAGTDVSKTSG